MPAQGRADPRGWIERVRWVLVPAAGFAALAFFARIAREVQERETTAILLGGAASCC